MSLKTSSLKLISLNELLDSREKEDVTDILLSFSSGDCKETNSSKDIENFFHNKCIEFEKSNLSRTFLVFFSDDKITYLAGYFSLANNPLMINAKNFKKITNSKKKLLAGVGYKRISGAINNEPTKSYGCPSILLGQLGKNFNIPQNITEEQKVTGAEILSASYEKIKEASSIVASRILYLECEDNSKLRSFYEGNGFSLLDNFDNSNGLLVYVKKISQL